MWVKIVGAALSTPHPQAQTHGLQTITSAVSGLFLPLRDWAEVHGVAPAMGQCQGVLTKPHNRATGVSSEP